MQHDTKIRAIFFDAAGTLIHLPKGVGFHYAEVARPFGAELSAKDLDKAFRAVWQSMPPPAPGPRPDDDKSWWRALVREVTRSIGVGIRPFDEFFEKVYARFEEPGVWQLFPEVSGVLGQLRGRYALAIVSNFDRRLRRVLRDLGIIDRFDAILISSEVGADKPDPRIFTAGCTALGLDPAEALHVGDDPVRDWDGARKAGLRVFPLDRGCNSLLHLPGFLAAASGGPA
jgi:putative hydrolase of the HAD superfamily